MQCTLAVKDLMKAISAIRELTKSEYANLVVDDHGFHVSGTGNAVNVSFTLEASDMVPGKASVDHSLLTSVLKGRTTVELKLVDSSLSFREVGGRRYSGNLVTLPYEEIVVNDDPSNTIKIKSDVQKSLDEAIALIGISNVYTDEPIYVWVESGKKEGMTVTCFDNYHMAHYSNPDVSLGKMKFQISLSVFKTLNTLCGGKAYHLEVSEGTLTAHNAEFKVNMPMTQSESEHGVDSVRTLLSTLNKEGWIDIGRSDLDQLLQNTVGAYEGRATPLTFKQGKKGAVAVIDGSYAKIKEVLQVKYKLKEPVSCDPSLLRDVLDLIKTDTIRIEVVYKKSLVIRQTVGSASVVYACGVV